VCHIGKLDTAHLLPMANTTDHIITINDPSILPMLMTTDETAFVLRVAPKTIRNWRTIGKGPEPVKVGGRTLYPRTNVLAFAGVAA